MLGVCWVVLHIANITKWWGAMDTSKVSPVSEPGKAQTIGFLRTSLCLVWSLCLGSPHCGFRVNGIKMSEVSIHWRKSLLKPLLGSGEESVLLILSIESENHIEG